MQEEMFKKVGWKDPETSSFIYRSPSKQIKEI